jgi:hypothetical protein
MNTAVYRKSPAVYSSKIKDFFMEPSSEAKQQSTPETSVENTAKQLAIAAQNAQIERMVAAIQKAEQLLDRHLAAGEKTVPARALHAILREAGFGTNREQKQEVKQAPQQQIEPKAVLVQRLNQFPNQFEVERIRAEERLRIHDQRAHHMNPIIRWWHGRELGAERRQLFNEVMRARSAAAVVNEVINQLRPTISQEPGNQRQTIINSQKQAVKQHQEIKPRQQGIKI